MNNHLRDHHLRFLSSHPQWVGMGWDGRGMALQLMTLGNFDDHYGTLPAEDALWRACLGLPTLPYAPPQSASAQKTMSDLFEQQIKAWQTVWKPILLRWFSLIDDAFLSKKPEYRDQKGRYWHPLVDLWREEAGDRQDQTAGDGKTVKPKKLKDGRQPSQERASQEKGAPKYTRIGRKNGAKRLILDDWDYPGIKYSKQVLLSCWDTPMSSEARTSLWDNAVGALAPGGDAKQKQIARQFLGKLIKDFGEKAVGQAVAVLLVRPVPPADPKAFLRKQLSDQSSGGTNSVQKAREARAKVSL